MVLIWPKPMAWRRPEAGRKSQPNFPGCRTHRPVPADPPRLRVLVADDHPLIREGIKACLSGESGIEVVGEAANGTEAMDKVRQLAPDI